MQGEDRAWIEYREMISGVYDDINYSSPVQSLVMRAGHRIAEKAFGDQAHFDRVLEIGAGTGEHLSFVRHSFGEYILTDLDPKPLEVAKNKLTGIHAGKVRFEIQAGNSLDYPDGAFDRLVAAHVLEHIYQPHLALKEWYRVLKRGGVLSILIPTDPGLAWRLGKHLGPRKNAIALGISHDYVQAREHVNSCNNLIAILRHYFPEAKETWWPFLHSIPVGYTIDGSRGIRDPRGMYGERLGVDMHVVTAASGPVRNLTTCIARCHLDIGALVVSPYAAGLASLVDDEMDLGVCVVDMGGGTTTLAVFFDGNVVYTDSIPAGGQHVTSDIARGLSTPLAHAERMKTLYGNCVPSPADEREMITVPQVGEEDRAQASTIPKIDPGRHHPAATRGDLRAGPLAPGDRAASTRSPAGESC